MMNTRPDPLKLFIVSGPKQKTLHLGFYVPNRTRPKALCRALPWNVLEAIVVKDEGEANCYRCHKKLESIFRAIKRLGHEWVCYAHYLPMEERTFEVPLNPKITINPR